MKLDNALLIFTIISVIAALVSTGIVYYYTATLTGHVTTGEANLTVESAAIVNFTTSLISWGSGRVNSGSTAASLTTFGTGNVTGGNWTLTTAGGLRIQNEGNTNVSLNLTVGKNASNFIGGTNTAYEWNVTNSETGSCLNQTGCGTCTGGLRLNTFRTANTTLNANVECYRFRFESGNDEIRIDFNLTVPEDSLKGALTDTITATATAV